jgi:hypothetical protein
MNRLCYALALGCVAVAACGDDDDQGGSASAPDAGAGAAGKGNASGSGGAAAGKGGAGAAGHAAGGGGGAHAGAGGQEAGSGEDAGVAEDAGETPSFAITLSTSACFGFCPEYDVTIDQSGSVAFDGRNNTKQEGKASKQVPAADAAAVYDALVAADYWSLRDSYRNDADGCRSVVTDAPTYTWTVTAEGKPSKMIADYLGCKGAPGLDALRAAETLIVDKAAISDWIGPNK